MNKLPQKFNSFESRECGGFDLFDHLLVQISIILLVNNSMFNFYRENSFAIAFRVGMGGWLVDGPLGKPSKKINSGYNEFSTISLPPLMNSEKSDSGQTPYLL